MTPKDPSEAVVSKLPMYVVSHTYRDRHTTNFCIPQTGSHLTRITESILAVITSRYENQLLSLSYTVNAAVSVKFDSCELK